jgi:hypothetical protein
MHLSLPSTIQFPFLSGAVGREITCTQNNNYDHTDRDGDADEDVIYVTIGGGIGGIGAVVSGG